MERWDYRVLPWPEDVEAVADLNCQDFAESLESILNNQGGEGFELSNVVERPAELGGAMPQSFLVLRRRGPSGDADYRRVELD